MATRRPSEPTRSPKASVPARAKPPTTPAAAPVAAAPPRAKAEPSQTAPPPSATAAAAPVAKTTAPKRSVKPKGAAAPRAQVSPETRRAMIAESAYLRAERRGFAPGYEVDDWCAAEREVDALLSAGTSETPQQGAH